MLQHDSLDALSTLLEEMTLSKRGPGLTQPPRFRRWEIGFAVGFIVAMLCCVIAVALYRYGDDQLVRHLPFWLPSAIYLVGFLCGVGNVVVTTVELYQMIRRDGKGPFAAILASFKKDMAGDVEFLTQLWTFNKPTLTYAFVQYSHRWNVLDGRQAVVAGDIRKVGLFPALAAAAMSAATLLKADSTFILWAPLILACCFYVVAFFIVPHCERPNQVVALLKYAIDHADHFAKIDPPPQASSEASPSPIARPPEAIAQTGPTSVIPAVALTT